MTIIRFKRSGGVLGQAINTEFDLDELPADAAQLLHNLISESRFFATPAHHEADSAPDEFEYTITVEAGQSIHTIQTTDTAMPESLRPLIQELTQLAKASER